MDFFEHQDKARSLSTKLLLYFFIALAAILFAVNFVVYISFLFIESPGEYSRWLDSDNSHWTFFLTLCVIFLGSFFRWRNLKRGGGDAVAQMAGARQINYDNANSKEKQYINVVEEMAIASGTPVPNIYIIDNELAINAFVAGYSASQAIICVTEGALKTFNRVELQAVVGHEFSHILNGDMRLNIKLMSLLAGILLIGEIGGFLLHNNSARRRWKVSSERNGGNLLPLGIALILIGYVGVFFGRLIKAGVSRQREYLADASAVQFTRNKDGIAQALYKIQQNQFGAVLKGKYGESLSHMCFGASREFSFAKMLATHPPLEDRIKRVSPTFFTQKKYEKMVDDVSEESLQQQPQKTSEPLLNMSGAQMLSSIGEVQPVHLVIAHQLYRSIPQVVRTWTHQSDGAIAFILGQVLVASPKHQQAILNQAKRQYPKACVCLKKFWPFIKANKVELRAPVLELCIATLKKLPQEKAQEFIDVLQGWVEFDQKLEGFEWVMLVLITKQLAPKMIKHKKISNLAAGEQDIKLVLSTLVYANSEPKVAAMHYQQSMKALMFNQRMPLKANQCDLPHFEQAIFKLAALPFIHRKSVLTYCADIILSNKVVTHFEYEKLKVVAEIFECPMPALGDSLS